MTGAADILAECEKLGLRVEARPGRNALWVEPIASVPKSLEVKLISNKTQILAYLAKCATVDSDALCSVLGELDELGVYRDGSSLCLRHPELATPELKELISRHYTSLVKLLAPREVI